MRPHVQAGSVYPSDGGKTSKNSKITVLTSASGKRATKLFTPQKVEGYARESRWRWREIEIGTFDDLARLLSQVERDPLSLIVQGTVAPAWRDKEIIPRTKAKGEPSLIDGGSRVIHFDIDDLPLALGTGWNDPEGVARAIWTSVIVARVPAFKDVSFYWQASSSAGTPGNEHLAKLHIWALLDQPIDEDQRKALLKLAGADHSLATINQANYVAAPIFDGVPDPLADVGRSGIVVGDRDHAAVDLIAWPKAEIRKAKARKPKQGKGPVVTPEGLDHDTTDEGHDLLDRACVKIKELPQGGRNNAINKIAFTVGGHVAGGSIAYGEAHSALMSAGLASGHDRYIEAVENGLRDGIQRPIARKEADQEIKPFHPAPEGDRDAAIAAHPATIRAWADQNIPIMQATKAVARAYAEINDDDQGPKEKAKAKRAIRRRIKDQFDLDFLPASKVTPKTPIGRLMLSGAQGLGKTRTVVGADGTPGILHRAVGLISVLFEPDHGMTAQAKRDYDDNAPEGSPPSIHVWGRGSPDPDQPDETMCRLPEIATALAQKGVSVRKALCEQCPFQHVCGYLRQEAEIARLAAAPEGVALFAPHDYAFLPLPAFVVPDLAIFDERPRDNGVGDPVGLSFGDLSETLRFDRPLNAQSAAHTTHEEADAQAANLRFIRPLQVALRDAGQNHPNRILAALRDRGIDRDHVKGAIAGLTYFQDRETAHAMRDVLKVWDFASRDGRAFNLESRLDREIEARDGKIARDLQTVFEALLIEIDKPRDDAIGIGVADVTRNGQRSKGIVAVKLKRLRLARVPFLHLDGTGDHGMAQMIFGKMDHAEHRVERSPAGRGDRIIQVVGTDFHTAGLIGGRKGKDGKIEPYTGTWADYYDAQRREIRKIISDRPGALVVANKAAIAALKPEEHGAHSAHFGAIRGRNDWSKINRVVIVGRDQPSPAAVERIARAYAAHGDADFESLGSTPYPEATRGIRKRDGSGHPVKVAYHPNAWGDRVLRSIRDTEIEQTIDRIRPIFKDRPIEVIVMSPVAVDLTVDQVVTWSQFRQGGTRVERALKLARIVPLSGREATRLVPEVWANRTTAQEDLSEAGLLAISLNRETYLQILPIRIGVVATYKTEVETGKRSREQTVLIAAPPHEARAVLERRTGALREFQVLKVFEPDQVAVEATEAREERIAIAMHDGGLSEAEAAKVADKVKTPPRIGNAGYVARIRIRTIIHPMPERRRTG